MTYRDPREIHLVVESFLSRLTSPEAFKHRAHLTVAVTFLTHSNLAVATARMRAGIQRFLALHNLEGKYNETLTLFWMRKVRETLDEQNRDLSLLELTNGVIETLGNSRLVFKYYSPERLWSAEARKTWVEPDLKSMDS